MYLQKGYINKALPVEDEVAWYLPHFLVVWPDIRTTKLCIVFNAAAKQHGMLFTDAIYPSPKLQRHLVDILTQF